MTYPTDVGAIDLMLGFPAADARKHYDYLRAQAKDAESKDMEFPAEYMFKGVPNHLEEGQDPLEVTLAEMDKHNVAIGVVGLGGKVTVRALKEYPDRFRASLEVDPNDVTGAVRKIRAAHDEHGIVCITVFPSGCMPQVPVNDPKL